LHIGEKWNKIVGMFNIDDKEIKRFETDLELFSERALPFATRSTINSAAFATQKLARKDLRKEFILRNKFSEQSIRVNMARSLKISQQASVVGTTAEYLEKQEFGGVKNRTGKEGVPLATSYSSGQPEGSQPRKKLPLSRNKLRNIVLQSKSRRAANRRQRNKVLVKQAAASGSKYIFMNLGRRKGIFRILGSKKNPRVKMIYDLSHESTPIHSKPWLKPAVDQTIPRMQEFYREALLFQIKRNNLFRS
jgi:hypothetical protein